MRMLAAFGLLALTSPSFVALFCLRDNRSKRWLTLIVRFNLALLKPFAPDPDTKRFLADFPVMIDGSDHNP